MPESDIEMIMTYVNILKKTTDVLLIHAIIYQENTVLPYSDQLKYFDKTTEVYLEAQSTAVTQTLLQQTRTFQHGTTDRRFVSTLQFSRGMDDKKHGSMSGPLVEQAVRRRHRSGTVSRGNSTPTQTSWKDC